MMTSTGVAGVRKVGRRLARVATGLALAGGTLLVAFPAAQASASTNQCGYGSSAGNTLSCVSVGNTVVTSSATVVSSARVLQTCIHDNGVRITCGSYTYVPAGGGISIDAVYPGGVPDGTWCAVTWRLNTDGTTTELDSECVGVTSVG